MSRLGQLWKQRRGMVIAISAVGLGFAGMGAARLARTAPNIPTAEVKLGDYVDYVQVRGEVKAKKSVIMTAPSGAGDIQIVELAKNGAMVKQGEVVAKFDTTTLQRTLDQKQTELKQAEAEIDRTRAQGRLTEEQTVTDLTKVRYDVERAKLEASKSEILSAIDGEKAKLNLSNAEQKLHEVEEKLRTDKLGSEADIESRKQKREKALFEVKQAERNLAALILHAPVDGMVTLMQNWRAGSFFGNAPEWRQGDRAWPGAGIVELPDITTVRVSARIEESDRGRLKAGLLATVRVDAVPDKEMSASVADISALAKLDFSGWPPAKNFDLILQLDQVDPRLRPGMSATARVAAERLKNSLLIPAEAAFQKDGRSVVYVLNGSRFEERPILISRRSTTQILVATGVKSGERVALKDPTLTETTGKGAAK